MKKGQKSTTFPLEWELVKNWENQLLMTFLQSEKEKDSTDLLMVSLGCRLGLRVGDLIRFRWRDLIETPAGETLMVVEQKTRKIRTLLITRKIKTIFNQVIRILKPNPDHFIFSSTHKKGLAPMTVQNFNLRLKKILKKYGVRTKGNASSHLLRKSFVLGCIQNGFQNGDHLSLVKVSHLVNHSSLSQTIKYVNFETSEMLNLMELD